ncbi:hypothetical protein AGABI1DRAFT_125508 [Agaricus bisporus var. burnettii JB137-S8]|uniref:Uncharacterized protein n=1 Tax=Agaricus bisporus var. burnettii (strain JB137-S8 / ATCC MYA-4627 / FGSC 10392) TaxID=597362 RepID=K5X587_AGABU|nr:uncharacterized protein AGABI1DRAFT_125508 [Agaricus bisporus var. burnettii JB137-S8]EKM83031.1 hypothetical protein AGABI1DRAFT_125508 [Agaricus bisporus var. burnettii JB137-S8]
MAQHQAILENIASTDNVESAFFFPSTAPQTNHDGRDDWSLIRDAVKQKIEENIQLYLTTTKPNPQPPPFSQTQTPNGGLKIAPFPTHKTVRVHLNEKPVSYMTPEEAQQAKKYVFEQLDSFSSAPFSVQRLCELCVKPKSHYNSVGKYLRAVEKSILVTSEWDSFPPLTEEEKDSFGRGATVLGSTRQSAPSTPLFSPIPFLHEDARRSQSRSPPPSPLALASAASTGDVSAQPLETKALGMVDEMDDPGPGHLSDHPTALSAVTELSGEHFNSQPESTSTTSTSASQSNTSTSRPLFGSLEQRFVRSGLMGPASDGMMVEENKENTQAQ